MKHLFLVFAVVLSYIPPSNALDVDIVRTSYAKAVQDKSLCWTMIQQLENHTNNNVYLAYLGAFQTIWANHVFSPVDKIMTFRTGRMNIEKAASSASNNIEVIFIRHSVQKNCPAFLGYNTHLEADRANLLKHRREITSTTLKNMVDNLLRQ